MKTMDILNLAKNPLAKKLLMKQLKGFFADEKVTAIVITLDQNNEPEIKVHTEKMVIMKQTTFDKLINS